jgi:hypothetical protein
VLLLLLISTSSLPGTIVLGIGVIILLVGIGFMVRGLSYRMENLPALQVSEVLARELDAKYTYVRNVSRRGLGYIDAVLIGPPGALVFRIVDKPGIYSNEGADWLERKGGQTFVLSRLNATRECVIDVYALRNYFARQALTDVPVYGVVVFTSSQAQITGRQPVVPIAELRTLTTVLRRDFLLQDRIPPEKVEAAVKSIYS